MLEWVEHLPVPWMALIIFGVTYLVALGILFLVTRQAARRRLGVFKGLSASMLSPLGTIFGLFGGFLAVQVWNDHQRATEAIGREASALRSIVILASSFPASTEREIDTLVRQQIQDAVTKEWPAMDRHRITLVSMPEPMVEALHLTLAQAPQGRGQFLAQDGMVRSLNEALDARRDRIILSNSTVSGVKWACLAMEAILILVATAMVHSENRAAAAVSTAIFATAIAASLLLIAAHAGPFSGQISVGPDVLLQVMPRAP
jgi:hypothetical protein